MPKDLWAKPNRNQVAHSTRLIVEQFLIFLDSEKLSLPTLSLLDDVSVLLIWEFVQVTE